MINFEEESFFKEIFDEASPSKRSDIRVVPIVNTNEVNSSCNDNIYDFSHLNDKEFYELYSSVQDKKTLGKFGNDNDNDDLEALLGKNNSDLNGIKISMNKKNKYGDLEMPSFEVLKSQRLEEDDIEALSNFFDAQFLEEGDYHYNGFQKDFPAPKNNQSVTGQVLDKSLDDIYDSSSSSDEDDHRNNNVHKNNHDETTYSSDDSVKIVGNLTSKLASDPIYWDEDLHHSPLNKVSACGPAPFIVKKPRLTKGN